MFWYNELVNHRGFSSLVIIIVVITILIGAGSFLILKNGDTQNDKSEEATTNKQTTCQPTEKANTSLSLSSMTFTIIPPDHYHASHFTISADGLHLAYSVSKGNVKEGRGFTVVDGEVGKSFDATGVPVFSPYGKTVAYVAFQGDKYFIVKNGEEGRPYEAKWEIRDASQRGLSLFGQKLALFTPIFSPDGKKLAYIGARNGKEFIVIDSQEGKPYDSINIGSVFSPDGCTVVYVATDDNKSFMVVNNKEGERYDHVDLYHEFSDDGQKILYSAKDGNKKFIIITDKTGKTLWKGKQYDNIDWQIVGPDNQTIIYSARRDAKEFIVIGEKEGKQYNEVSAPRISPNGQTIAYIAYTSGSQEDKSGERLFMVTVDKNGETLKEGKSYDDMGFAIFSPNGQKIAYAAEKDGKGSFVVIGDSESKAYNEIIGDPVFSSDGKYLAYGAKEKDKILWVVQEVK